MLWQGLKITRALSKNDKALRLLVVDTMERRASVLIHPRPARAPLPYGTWALRFFRIVARVHKNSLHVESTRDSRNISLIYVEAVIPIFPVKKGVPNKINISLLVRL